MQRPGGRKEGTVWGTLGSMGWLDEAGEAAGLGVLVGPLRSCALCCSQRV